MASIKKSTIVQRGHYTVLKNLSRNVQNAEANVTQFISLLCGTETQSIYMLSVMPHSSRFWSMLSARDCWWHKEHAPLNLIHFLIKRPTFQH